MNYRGLYPTDLECVHFDLRGSFEGLPEPALKLRNPSAFELECARRIVRTREWIRVFAEARQEIIYYRGTAP